MRAGLGARAEDWRQCSVGAHLSGRNDALVDVAPALARVAQFRDLVEYDSGETLAEGMFDEGDSIGRPLGDEAFLDEVEARLGYSVRPGRRGRTPAGGG